TGTAPAVSCPASLVCSAVLAFGDSASSWWACPLPDVVSAYVRRDLYAALVSARPGRASVASPPLDLPGARPTAGKLLVPQRRAGFTERRGPAVPDLCHGRTWP